jgi:hypothetical protein
MNILRFVEIALASWYVAFIITNTTGPFNIFKHIRTYLTLGGLTNCIICLIPWIALGLWLLPDGVVTWALASAGLGLAVHSSSGWRYGG